MGEGDEVRAIERLKARYFRLLDTKEWGALRSVFTEDVDVDMTGEGVDRFAGAEAYVTLLQGLLDETTTVHHGHTPEVELTSPTTATGVWAMQDEIWWPEGSPMTHLQGAGHYHETYRKGPDGWQISATRLTRLHRTIDLADGTQLRT